MSFCRTFPYSAVFRPGNGLRWTLKRGPGSSVIDGGVICGAIVLPSRAASLFRGFTRPVLKHGPRSLTCARVIGYESRPKGEMKVNRNETCNSTTVVYERDDACPQGPKCLDRGETRSSEAGRSPGAPRSPPCLFVVFGLRRHGADEAHPERTR